MTDMFDLADTKHQTSKRPLKYHYLTELQQMTMTGQAAQKYTRDTMDKSMKNFGKGIHRKRRK